jgi:uncharacterized protein
MPIAVVNVRYPEGGRARVLIIPGLQNSGPKHWQTWLQSQYADAARVEQDDWSVANLDGWARRIEDTVLAHLGASWVAVAHSFGCLALARYLQRRRESVSAALFVAPADARKFGIAHRLPLAPLGVSSTLIASETDPWMGLESAGAWALLWAARFINLGPAGHINAEAGFGPFPIAKQIVERRRVTSATATVAPAAPRHDAVLRLAM